METLLAESPKSTSAGEYRQMLEQIKDEEAGRLVASNAPTGPKLTEPQPVVVDDAFHGPTAEEMFQRVQQAIQDKKEENQIAEAEAEPDASCVRCGGGALTAAAGAAPSRSASNAPGAFVAAGSHDVPAASATLRVAVDEVAIFFAA